jgi:hypothetical protein
LEVVIRIVTRILNVDINVIENVILIKKIKAFLKDILDRNAECNVKELVNLAVILVLTSVINVSPHVSLVQ